MARFTHETLRVQWVVTIANRNAPTAAELNAGTNLSPLIPVDGVAFGGSRNNAEQAMLGDAFVSQEPGTWGETMEITFVRDITADTAWDLFAGGYKTVGHIVFRRTGTGTFSAAQKVEVYPVTTHEPLPLASAENEYSKFTVTFAITAAPSKEAAVA